MTSGDILIAPLQGFTDAVWRRAHSRIMKAEGVEPVYFAPFARVDHGEVRPRDLRDIGSADSSACQLVPQAIFKNCEELLLITEAIAARGFTRIDLNMGCPFAPQVKAGRGASAAVNPLLLRDLRSFIDSHPSLSFSIKMRPGVVSVDEWCTVAPLLNELNVCHITLHPRPAKAAYHGTVDLDCFANFLTQIKHPVYYNGDVLSPTDYLRIRREFPQAVGVMIGRGMLSRPSLAAEIASDLEWEPARRAELWLTLMRSIANDLALNSQGEKQALDRLKPRLEYYDPQAIDKRLIKALSKAKSVSTFLSLLH